MFLLLWCLPIADVAVLLKGDVGISTTPGVVHVPPQSELPVDAKEPPKPPVELAVMEEPLTFDRIKGISKESF